MASGTETVDIVIQSLINAGIKYVFGVPGAKIVSEWQESPVPGLLGCPWLQPHPSDKL